MSTENPMILAAELEAMRNGDGALPPLDSPNGLLEARTAPRVWMLPPEALAHVNACRNDATAAQQRYETALLMVRSMLGLPAGLEVNLDFQTGMLVERRPGDGGNVDAA